MALILYRPIFWALYVLLSLLLFWLARRLRLRWLPAWIIRVLLIGLVLFVIFSPRGEIFRQEIPQRQVLLVDQSDSIPPQTRQHIQSQAQAWQVGGLNRLVVVFGSQAEPVYSSVDPWLEIDGRATNLISALELAGELLGGTAGDILLASDGIVPSEPQVTAAISKLHALGHRIDVIRLPTLEVKNDVFVGPLWTPASLWEGSPFAAVMLVYAPVAGEVTLRLRVDGELHSERIEPMATGENYYVFAPEAKTREIMTLQAEAIFAGDPRPENNRSYATVQVFRAPRALFITQPEAYTARFLEALSQSGLQVVTQSPTDLPTDLKALGDYQVIILHDIMVQSITQEQMLALKVFVSRQGGGLILLGGRNSYTLGGYQNTVLEPMLPVKLEPAPRKERPPITFVIILDSSGSMGEVHGVVPIDLAREAAMRAVEILNSEDFVGVMTYSDEPVWDVPIAQVGEGLTLRQALDAVSRIKATGGTYMYKALLQALVLLEQDTVSSAESRQVLLLSDGRSYDGNQVEFRKLAQSAQAQGITISTIALGDEADQDIMSLIAKEAGGRYHLVLDAAELPRIMISESRAARSENIQLGKTTLVAGEPDHPVLSGFSLADLPPLNGYNALTSKTDEGAEDILLSASFQDPVLSAWQYGLGRVIAWMGDLGEEWAGQWVSWHNSGLFWSQVFRYALLNPSLGPTQVEVQAGDSQLFVNVQIQSHVGVPFNLAQPSFSYAEDQETIRSFTIPQTGAGVYSLEIPRPPEGAYRAVIEYRDGEETIEVPAFFEVNYPTEWQPGDGKIGQANLSTWAQAGGGEETLLEDAQALTETTRSQARPDQLWWQLLLTVTLLWPVEIAIRRRWLPWQ